MPYKRASLWVSKPGTPFTTYQQIKFFTGNFVMARFWNIIRISEFLASIDGVAAIYSSKPKISASETNSLYRGISVTPSYSSPMRLQEYLDRQVGSLGGAFSLCKCRQIPIILLISAHQIDEKWLSNIVMHHVLNLLIFDCTGWLLMFEPPNSTIYELNSPPAPSVDGSELRLHNKKKFVATIDHCVWVTF